MDGARSFCIDMAWETPSGAEASDKIVQTFGILRTLWVKFGERAFEPQVGQD